MYTIGNFITSIKNISMAGKAETDAPFSRACLAIANVLVKEGYLEKVEQDKEQRKIHVVLAYRGKEPVLTNVKLISKPGLRVYEKIKRIKSDKIGILILSTPRGIMSDKTAKKLGLGGEVIAQIW